MQRVYAFVPAWAKRFVELNEGTAYTYDRAFIKMLDEAWRGRGL